MDFAPGSDGLHIVAAAPDAVVEMDAAGRLTRWSAEAETLFGWSAAEALGRSMADTIIPERWRAAHRRGLQEFLATGQGPVIRRRVEFEGLRRDGSEFPLELTVIPHNDDGVWSFTAWLRDISERRRSENELRHALSLLSATLEATADGILVVDHGGKILSYNRQFAGQWRLPREILDTRDDALAITHVLSQLSDPDGFVKKVQELYADPDAESFDVLAFKDGRVFERYSKPQHIEGRIVGRVWSFRDVSSRVRAERIQAALYRISEAASNAPSLPALYLALHEIIMGLMEAKNFYIALYDPATEMISFPYFVDEEEPQPPPEKMGHGLTAWVLRTGQPLLATAEVFRAMVARGDVDLVGREGVDWLGVPLRSGGRVFGVLAAQTYAETSRYGEAEKNILSFVSDQVARAIERKRTLEELKESESKYRLLFDSNVQAMWVYEPGTLRFLAVNEATLKRYGYAREEFLAMRLDDLRLHEERPAFREMLRGAREIMSYPGHRHLRKDGTVIDVEITAHPIAFEGRPARLVLADDVTERKRLEEELRQAQRMEAVGRLAGGVAHDFNNILTAIMGYGDLLSERLQPDDPRRADLDQIIAPGNRASELTRQLLAFGRKQVLRPARLDLNELVENLHGMLLRLLGAHVELTTSPAANLGQVYADAGQLEQVIVNLAVNARDAMPAGGKLTIETANVELEASAGPPPVTAGPYVLLAVTDTGTGIDAETKAHIFEPFFTTKTVGKGTGLGLATVHGIVQQSGGVVSVYSEPGRGTTFKIYLPRVENAPAEAQPSPPSAAPAVGSETVLLVEDDARVRELAQRVLEARGYQVLVANDGAEGGRVAAGYAGAIHILVTDVVMPAAGGPELARLLRPRRPAMRVLFLSGYADSAFARSGELTRDAAFLQKPFTPERLAQKVREVLDGPAPGSA